MYHPAASLKIKVYPYSIRIRGNQRPDVLCIFIALNLLGTGLAAHNFVISQYGCDIDARPLDLERIFDSLPPPLPPPDAFREIHVNLRK